MRTTPIEMYQDQLKREAWIYWNWIDVTPLSEERVRLLRGRPRTISEAAIAADQWDTWNEAKRELEEGRTVIDPWQEQT